MISNILGLLAGLTLGIGFTWLQSRAAQKYAHLAATSRLERTPGAMTRTAVLMMALVGVQVALPTANLWWTTGGLVIALLVPMSWRMRRMLQAR